MLSVFGEPEGALLVVPMGTHHEKGQRVLPLCWTHSSEVMGRVPGRSLAAALLPGCEGALLELCRLLHRAGSVLRGDGGLLPAPRVPGVQRRQKVAPDLGAASQWGEPSALALGQLFSEAVVNPSRCSG